MKRNRKNLFFDEITVDRIDSRLGRRELPLHNFIFHAVVGSFLCLGLIVILRVAWLGVLRHDFYRARADSNVNKITAIAADRGLITDRYGEKMVHNIPILSLRLRPAELVKYDEALAVKSLLAKLGVTEDDLNETLSEHNLASSNEVVIKKEISASEAIIVESSGIKSIYAAKDTKRAFTEVFSHIVGYVGFPTRKEIKEKNLTSVDVVGRTNIEAIYDSILRGVNGEIVEHRNARGDFLGTHTFSDPQSGQTLKTTIDADLQKYFYKRLSEALVGAGPGGVGIAVNPLNGEVLSLISLPGFSSTSIIKGLTDSAKPLFNRAVSGLYSPGSTIKPFVAAAALKERVVNTEDMVLSAGYLDIPNRYNPDNPTRFADWKAHGWVDIYSALARSSNIFFYAVGGGLPHNENLFMGASDVLRGLKVSRLQQYFSLFGFDKKTGIPLLGESEGYLPSAESKRERTGISWTIGDTYNISIGQGDLVVTPIALINAVSAIVNGGVIYRPNLILGNAPEKIADLTHLSNELSSVVEGMKDAVRKPYGTAVMLNALPFEVSGKTGTAQVGDQGRINAFFVGCGPLPLESENYTPICILVLIENARAEGLNAVPVARDVFQWYYDNRINASYNVRE